MMSRRLAVGLVVFAAACSGAQANRYLCGEGTSERHGECVPNRQGVAVLVPDSEPDRSADERPGAEHDEATMARLAAEMCGCKSAACAIEVSDKLGAWSGGKGPALTPAVQQSTRIYLTCVAQIEAAPEAASEPRDDAETRARQASVEEFKKEYREVGALLKTLADREPARAESPMRIYEAVKTNHRLAQDDAEIRAAMMRLLATVREATQTRLESPKR